MPIPRDLLTDPNPGTRVARLAREAVDNPIMIGPQGKDPLKTALDKWSCWHAATFLAWVARGINLQHQLQNPTDVQINAYLLKNLYLFNVVSPATPVAPQDFQRLFPNWQQRIVPNAAGLAALQSGCFIGFIRQDPPPGNNAPAPAPKLRHVMLNTMQGTGEAAGTNNTGVFNNAAGNWSLVRLDTFFTSAAHQHENTQMVFTNVTGQTI